MCVCVPHHAILCCAKWIRDVSALRWRSYTCFCPFCGSVNYPVFVKNFLLLVCTLFYIKHSVLSVPSNKMHLVADLCRAVVCHGIVIVKLRCHGG